MLRKLVAVAVVGMGLVTLAPAVHAAIYSPTQAELLGLVYADFVDNEDPDLSQFYTPVANGTDAVDITFDVDWDINDELYRTASVNSSFAHDFTGLDAFSITFSNPSSFDGLGYSAQIYIRSGVTLGYNDFVAIGHTISPTNPTTLSIPVGLIGYPSDINEFGIEFFADEGITVPDGMTGFGVTAATSPQPPVVDDFTLYSWETPNDPGTPENEQLEGWGTNPAPEFAGNNHTHTISTDWASDGTYSTKVVRTVGDALYSWGSLRGLDANAGGSAPATGDYNNNGAVDAADYTVWRDNLGTAYELPNRDPENAGNVSEADYGSWKSNFGATGGGPDPAIMAEIGEFVTELTDPGTYAIAFDLHIEDQTLLGYSNPTWLKFTLAVAVDNGDPELGAWFQSSEFEIPSGYIGDNLESTPVDMTVQFLLSDLEDFNHPGDFLSEGINPNTQYLNFLISTNGSWTTGVGDQFTFYMDNFRFQEYATPGAGSLAAVPEPSAVVLALVAGLGVIGFRRR
jgi:hypothetical protein